MTAIPAFKDYTAAGTTFTGADANYNFGIAKGFVEGSITGTDKMDHQNMVTTSGYMPIAISREQLTSVGAATWPLYHGELPAQGSVDSEEYVYRFQVYCGGYAGNALSIRVGVDDGGGLVTVASLTVSGTGFQTMDLAPKYLVVPGYVLNITATTAAGGTYDHLSATVFTEQLIQEPS
jgi:hypothetical protein